MAAPARLTTLLEPLLESLGFELVLLEFQTIPGASILRLYIEPARAWRHARRLSAGQPGSLGTARRPKTRLPAPTGSRSLRRDWDRLLTKPAHFARFAGEEVKLQTFEPIDNRRRWGGLLKGLDDQGRVLLEVPEQGLVAFPPEAIERARVVPDYTKEFQQDIQAR